MKQVRNGLSFHNFMAFDEKSDKIAQDTFIDFSDSVSEISSEFDDFHWELSIQNIVAQSQQDHEQSLTESELNTEPNKSSSVQPMITLKQHKKTSINKIKATNIISQTKRQRKRHKRQQKKPIIRCPNSSIDMNQQNKSNKLITKSISLPKKFVANHRENEERVTQRQQVDFWRSHQLHKRIIHRNLEHKLVTILVSIDPYMLASSLKNQLTPIPHSFHSFQQYEQQLSKALLAEVNYRIIESLNSMRANEQKHPSLSLKIISQTFRSDNLYELKVVGKDDQSLFKLKQLVSKYRIVLFRLKFQPTFHLAGFIEASKRQKGNDWVLLITGKYIELLPTEIQLYDLQKYATEIREFDAVHSLQYSELCMDVLTRPRWVIESQQCNTMNIVEMHQNLRSHFNQSQYEAIKTIARKQQGVHLLQGPPGTGKTYTLLGILACEFSKLKIYRQTYPNLNLKILVCTPSNAAADHIAAQIFTQKLISSSGQLFVPKLLRVSAQQCPSIKSISLYDIMSQLQSLQKYKSHLQKTYINQMIYSIKRELQNTQQLRDAYRFDKQLELGFYEELLNSSNQYVSIRQALNRIEKKYIHEADIIITTLSYSFSEKLTSCNLNFTCLAVDEAGQATQPSTLIPLQWGMKKMILIGDPFQLPPFTLNPSSLQNNYDRSLIGRYIDNGVEPIFLSVQYRMDPLIRAFPSLQFYDNRLEDANQIKQRINKLIIDIRPVTFINCLHGQEVRHNKSFCNAIQAQLVQILVFMLLNTKLSIGVITPYQGQQQIISERLNTRNASLSWKNKQVFRIWEQVTVSTVDSYQGQERDIIIISTVRANKERNIGFTSDFRRINVALTRAKYAVITVGNAPTLYANELWAKYMEWIKQHGFIITHSKQSPAKPITNMMMPADKKPSRAIPIIQLPSND